MGDNTNKNKILTAIWDNPATAFDCEFIATRSGNVWESRKGEQFDERGAIRLLRKKDGEGITVFANHGNHDATKGNYDVFTYLGEYKFNNGGDFKETLQELAKLYGVSLEYSADERKAMTQQALAREFTPYLVEALKRNPQGTAAKYLTEKRGIELDEHFGELTEDVIKQATEALRLRDYKFSVEDVKALGLTYEHARQGYNVVIPNYRNGKVVGFVLRNTTPNCSDGDRYRYSDGLGRGVYCDKLEIGIPVTVVEGQFDAIRLRQAGVKNVIAMGGAQITDDFAKLLKSRNITEVYYIPDLEYNLNGEQDTTLIQKAIKAFQSVKVDGEPVIKTLYVSEIPTPEDKTKYPKVKDGKTVGYKIDADTYGKERGTGAVVELCEGIGAVAWYDWELENLITWAKAQDAAKGAVNIGAFCERFDEIYNRSASTYERQRIRNYIQGGKYKDVFKAFGVTPQALDDKDEWNRNREYNNRIRAAATDLSNAVEEQANPATVAAILERLNEAQGTNTRDEWEQQLTETFEDELQAIKEQPDTLKTKWELGNITKTNDYVKYENIEFYPADISVFCAPTSHGKTMILFQSVLDLIRTTNKSYLFVSCEENKRQLLERALNVYLNIETTDKGKTSTGDYCFIKGTRKKSIKAVLRGDVPPFGYPEYMGKSEHFDALTKKVKQGVEAYGKYVRPRLKLIHTEATAESICNNILHYVKEYRAQGVEIGGVFVDYMQLLTAEGKAFSRHDELKSICKALKDCAARTELPVVIAAQLNRDVMKKEIGVDGVTVANIGEGADIERIAHDIYFVWQVDKTPLNHYVVMDYPRKENGQKDNTAAKVETYDIKGQRSNRLFTTDRLHPQERELKTGYIYIEQMKARDGKTDGWGLFPFDGERGFIGEIDKTAMK